MDIPEELICPISLDLMVSPVMLLQSGQIYDCTHFAQWLKEGGTTDPLTNVPLESPVTLRPLLSLRKKAEEFAMASGTNLGPADYKRVKFVSNPANNLGRDSQSSQTSESSPTEARNSRKIMRVAKKLVTFLMTPNPVVTRYH